MSIPQKAWNSTPGGTKTGRLAQSGREAPGGTRCTVVIDDQECGRFPAWQVPGAKHQRHCEYHRQEAKGLPLTEAQEGSLRRGA